MKKSHVIAAACALAAAAPLVPGVPGSIHIAVAAPPAVSFKEDVLPVLQVRCGACHAAPNGEGYKASGLNLMSYGGVKAGTKFGPMVIAGSPETSNLMRLLDWQISPQLRMPHNQKQLSICDRDTIRTWIREGAKDN